jgi:FixJ family two-component response regulator
MITERLPVPAPSAPVVGVDDDPAVYGSLKFLLELEGFAVRAYGAAAELLDDKPFDNIGCFVIDQKMPGMTGMELVAKLRDKKILTPAILLVSDPNVAIRGRAAKAAIPVIEKPLLGSALIDTIRELCRRV